MMRTALVLLALGGLAVIPLGIALSADDAPAGLVLVWFVGVPGLSLLLLLLSFGDKRRSRDEIRRERNTMLLAAVTTAAFLLPSLLLQAPWLAATAAVMPVLAGLAHLTVFRPARAA